jgi:hypothetical protein
MKHKPALGNSRLAPRATRGLILERAGAAIAGAVATTACVWSAAAETAASAWFAAQSDDVKLEDPQ